MPMYPRARSRLGPERLGMNGPIFIPARSRPHRNREGREATRLTKVFGRNYQKRRLEVYVATALHFIVGAFASANRSRHLDDGVNDSDRSSHSRAGLRGS